MNLKLNNIKLDLMTLSTTVAAIIFSITLIAILFSFQATPLKSGHVYKTTLELTQYWQWQHKNDKVNITLVKALDKIFNQVKSSSQNKLSFKVMKGREIKLQVKAKKFTSNTQMLVETSNVNSKISYSKTSKIQTQNTFPAQLNLSNRKQTISSTVLTKSTEQNKPIIYTVKRGDSLWTIARKFKVKLINLIEYNHLKTAMLKEGQKLLIPPASYKAKGNVDLAMFLEKPKHISKKYMFSSPLRGKIIITSPFGYRIHPVYHIRLLHTGIDLRGKIGRPVYAAADGVVTFVGWLRGYGKVIVIKHKKGFETRYAHLSKILVKNGQHVKKGQVIGKVGKTGIATGPHLHFEIRKYGKPVNPLKYTRL